MQKADQQRSATELPTVFEAELALSGAHRTFQRALSCWASDVLRLRALGLVAPSWTAADRGHDGISQAA